MVPPMYPELKRVMTIVRRPVRGPRVAINAVATPPRAPKQSIVATALLERISLFAISCLRVTYLKLKVKVDWASIPMGMVSNTVLTDLHICQGA
jgi:hypothetical protein